MIEQGFVQSSTTPSFFWKIYQDGLVNKLLDYIDDLLYFCESEVTLKIFKDSLVSRFNIEFLGQAHRYLLARTTQSTDFCITLEQLCYCKSVLNHYLKKTGMKHNNKHHYIPLHYDFVPSIEDCAATDEESKKIQEGYNIDFASCIGDLICLAYTHPDIIYMVAKFLKFT